MKQQAYFTHKHVMFDDLFDETTPQHTEETWKFMQTVCADTLFLDDYFFI